MIWTTIEMLIKLIFNKLLICQLMDLVKNKQQSGKKLQKEWEKYQGDSVKIWWLIYLIISSV